MGKSSLLTCKLLSELDVQKLEQETMSLEKIGFMKMDNLEPKPINIVLEYLRAHKNGILGGSLTKSDLRLDVIVNHGNKDENANFFKAETIKYTSVSDGDELIKEFENKLLFSGNSKYFLNFQMMLSRDKPNSKSLEDILKPDTIKTTLPNSFNDIVALSTAVNPTAALVGAAINGALTIGRFAWDLLDTHTDKTIFSYDKVWFQNRHNFGIGRHPEENTLLVDDGEFFFTIFEGF